MKVIKYIAAVLLIITGGATLSAMPPLPELEQKFRNQGINGERREKFPDVYSGSSMKRSAATGKSYPSSGTMRIPVLLVRYGTPYTSSSFSNPVSSFNKDFNKPGILFLTSLIILMIFTLSSANRRRVIKPLVSLYGFAAVMFISCGVDKSDEGIEFPTDISLYNTILNGSTTSDLSARKYFSDMSNGNLNVQFDFFGPVQVSKSWNYYGANDSVSPFSDLHPGELVGEAVRLMVSKYGSTDFSVYDNNGDGQVESVLVLHEGPGEESGAEADTIWSHEYNLHSANSTGDGTGPVYVDGIKIDSYAIVPEYKTTRGDSTIGVFCHELGHAMGLPDLYDTTGATDGSGDWSVMGSGSWGGSPAGSKPAPMLAWERNYLGGSSWITISQVTSTGVQTVNDIETAPRTAYKVSLKDPAGSQYLIIEGKTASGAAGWYVPGSGVLVTHIHEGIISSYAATNTVNDGSTRVHGVNVVEADGNNSLWTAGGDKGIDADLYKSGKTLDNATNPDTKYYTDENLSGKTGVSGVALTGFSAVTVPMTVTITP